MEKPFGVAYDYARLSRDRDSTPDRFTTPVHRLDVQFVAGRSAYSSWPEGVLNVERSILQLTLFSTNPSSNHLPGRHSRIVRISTLTTSVLPFFRINFAVLFCFVCAVGDNYQLNLVLDRKR